MKPRNLVLGSVLAVSTLGLLTTGIVNAGPCGGCDAPFGARHATLERHGPRPGGPANNLLKRLDLTDEQRDQIFEIHHAQQPAVREKMEALRKGREALRNAAMAENYDSKAVRTLADQQGMLKAELIVMRNATFNRIYTLLTPEQREQIKQMKKKRGTGFQRP